MQWFMKVSTRFRLGFVFFAFFIPGYAVQLAWIFGANIEKGNCLWTLLILPSTFFVFVWYDKNLLWLELRTINMIVALVAVFGSSLTLAHMMAYDERSVIPICIALQMCVALFDDCASYHNQVQPGRRKAGIPAAKTLSFIGIIPSVISLLALNIMVSLGLMVDLKSVPLFASRMHSQDKAVAPFTTSSLYVAFSVSL